MNVKDKFSNPQRRLYRQVTLHTLWFTIVNTYYFFTQILQLIRNRTVLRNNYQYVRVYSNLYENFWCVYNINYTVNVHYVDAIIYV